MAASSRVGHTAQHARGPGGDSSAELRGSSDADRPATRRDCTGCSRANGRRTRALYLSWSSEFAPCPDNVTQGIRGCRACADYGTSYISTVASENAAGRGPESIGASAESPALPSSPPIAGPPRSAVPLPVSPPSTRPAVAVAPGDGRGSLGTAQGVPVAPSRLARVAGLSPAPGSSVRVKLPSGVWLTAKGVVTSRAGTHLIDVIVTIKAGKRTQRVVRLVVR